MKSGARCVYGKRTRKEQKSKGYPSPICVDKEATDSNYDAAVII